MRYTLLFLVIISGCCSVPRMEIATGGEINEAGKARAYVTAKAVWSE